MSTRCRMSVGASGLGWTLQLYLLDQWPVLHISVFGMYVLYILLPLHIPEPEFSPWLPDVLKWRLANKMGGFVPSFLR